jgi:ataxin-3
MALNVKDVIFFEKQDGMLCAQHALNMLLQGPYFTAVDLADIANELDTREKQMLRESDRANFRSQNLDDTGFFSIQVITVALQCSWNLNLVPIRSPTLAEYAANPETAQAFVCNLAEHWFTLRKFHNQWYILNSTKNGPEAITESYLSLYLNQLFVEGYSILYVDGFLPICVADEVAQTAFIMAESIKIDDVEDQSDDTPMPSAPSLDEDEALNMAIALSLDESNKAKSKSTDQPSSSSKPVNLPSPPVKQSQAPVPSTSQSTNVNKSEAEVLRERREHFLKRFENNE